MFKELFNGEPFEILSRDGDEVRVRIWTGGTPRDIFVLLKEVEQKEK